MIRILLRLKTMLKFVVMDKLPVDVLKEFKLRKTACRIDLLNIFLNKQNVSVSQSEIEKIVGNQYDRATVYRTLITFEEKGIVHRVIVEGHGAQFALCEDSCDEEGHHHHDHIHFKCTSCGKTECLNEVSFIQAKLPEGYEKKHANYLVIGTCSVCS